MRPQVFEDLCFFLNDLGGFGRRNFAFVFDQGLDLDAGGLNGFNIGDKQFASRR